MAQPIRLSVKSLRSLHTPLMRVGNGTIDFVPYLSVKAGMLPSFPPVRVRELNASQRSNFATGLVARRSSIRTATTLR
jgi:hypothetical protein